MKGILYISGPGEKIIPDAIREQYDVIEVEGKGEVKILRESSDLDMRADELARVQMDKLVASFIKVINDVGADHGTLIPVHTMYEAVQEWRKKNILE